MTPPERIFSCNRCVFRYLVTKFILISAAIKEPQWPYSDWEYIWPLFVVDKSFFMHSRAQKQLSVLSFWIATTMLLVFTICPLPKLPLAAQTYIPPSLVPQIQSIPHPSPSSKTHTLQATIVNVPSLTYTCMTRIHTGPPLGQIQSRMFAGQQLVFPSCNYT